MASAGLSSEPAASRPALQLLAVLSGTHRGLENITMGQQKGWRGPGSAFIPSLQGDWLQKEGAN